MNLDNHYSQLFDYLIQIRNLSVLQNEIASHLNVDGGGVSRFLNKKTSAPKKMLTNFVRRYFQEYSRWPQNSSTIGRKLNHGDVLYFRNPTQNLPSCMAQISNVSMSQLAPVPLLPMVTIPNPVATVFLPQVFHPAVTQTAPIVTSTPTVLPLPVQSQINAAPLPRPSVTLHNPAAPGVSTAAVQLPPVTNVNRLARLRKTSTPRAPIIISYRGHQTDKDGVGMVFDHMRLQELTRVATKVLLPDISGMAVIETIKIYFKNSLWENGAQLTFGNAVRHQYINPKPPKNEETNNNVVKVIVEPEYTTNPSEDGLLLIPGRARAIENESIRLAHEFKVIKQALNRGQPMLGICAGSWRVWIQCLEWINNPSRKSSTEWTNIINNSLIDVKDHCYAQMLSLKVNGRDCGYNKEIHDVILADSNLKQISGITRMTVNSVHWKAINPNTVIKNFRSCATSAVNPNIEVHHRNKSLMIPQDCVEAFESVFGAPILGIQWHLEGYDRGTPHARILDYMAKAGDAYSAKRKMLAQFRTKHTPK